MVMKLENIKYDEEVFNDKQVKHNFKPYDTISNKFFNNFKKRYLGKQSSSEKYQNSSTKESSSGGPKSSMQLESK